MNVASLHSALISNNLVLSLSIAAAPMGGGGGGGGGGGQNTTCRIATQTTQPKTFKVAQPQIVNYEFTIVMDASAILHYVTICYCSTHNS